MKNADLPAFTIADQLAYRISAEISRGEPISLYSKIRMGLTKREHYAMAAMQGILASDTEQVLQPETVVNDALLIADAMLKTLEEKVGDES